MKHGDFDVVVIGGGHAGCEAAAASARMGVRTALITLDASKIGVMSCNPAIGGLGKGHLVREIDALDGIMGRCADLAGIQFRLLNRRKGPAVQGPRTQIDRNLYQKAITSELSSLKDLEIVEGEVVDLLVREDQLKGVMLADDVEVSASKVILTTGTFLNGLVHIGDETFPAGRLGEQNTSRLGARLSDLSLPMGRLKTGTPPRLDGRTIDWSVCDEQKGDEEPTFFSFLTTGSNLKQVSCGITHTNVATHEIIQKNLHRSAMYSGTIKGTGPRYCPSIEDKVARFADKASHQIFLEPEGLDDDTIYPNGISTSLPTSVQADYVRSIKGLKEAVITQPGYAIEYDFVDPRALDINLQVRALPGLYLAGQINGTTGYEEAATQGLVAAIAASQSMRGDTRSVFQRSNSYIGVMLDDLTTQGVTEPYRMFTSRAEYRLSLRADNADQRLTEAGIEIGCVSVERREAFRMKSQKLDSARQLLSAMSVTPKQARSAGLDIKEDGKRRDGFELLAFPDAVFDDLVSLNVDLKEVAPEARSQVEREALYKSYENRQGLEAERLSTSGAERIPADMSYGDLNGLSNELLTKLLSVRPETIGQASRIEGMTPAALVLILAQVKRLKRKAG